MTQVLEQSLTVDTNKIISGIEAFESKKTEVQTLADSAEGLKIVGVDDKEGLKAVSTKRKERKAARQPDKVKIQEYINAVKSIPVPEMKTQDGKDVMVFIQELISRFDNYATEKSNEL